MNRRLFDCVVLVLLVIALAGGVAPVYAQFGDGTLRYDSVPDAVALYQGDLAYIRDEFTIPGGVEVEIVLPPTVLRESVIVIEAGERLRSYRYRFALNGGGPAILLPSRDVDATRTILLTYLASGAGWSPLYDMDVLDVDRVQFGFDVAIRNDMLDLADVDVRLVAGMPGADPGYTPQATVTQMNVLYEEPQGGTLVGGAVTINHVYPVGVLTIPRGEIVRWNLFYDELDARRLIVWDARFGQRVDVIYKVTNGSEVPFVAGQVQAYEDGLYIGQDALEWTPTGGEGSLTVGGLSTVRVRRTESVEDIGTFSDDRYRYTITLAMTNFGGEALDLIVLDEWNRAGQSFQFDQEPQRQGNNVLRWEVTVPAGESLTLTYTYIVD